jgi:FtsZ-binding cell division protein ZapB
LRWVEFKSTIGAGQLNWEMPSKNTVFAQGAVMERRQENQENLENEINDLKNQLEQFQHEKERVRAIIGKLGGVPKFRTKLINVIFITVVSVCVAVSIIGGQKVRPVMIELTIVALSLKIIYLIHSQMRINHFEFWILSAIEWRINEIMTYIKQLKR